MLLSKVLGLNSFRYPTDEIRDKLDIADIISAHVALHKRGRRLVGLCPFHGEKTPSFYVDPDRKMWKCFGCGEGGDIFTFVSKIDSLTFPETVEILAKKAGVHIDRSPQAMDKLSERDRILKANTAACALFTKQLTKSAKAQAYLAKRSISPEAAEKYKLGYAPESWDELSKYLAKENINLQDAAKAGLVVARDKSNGFYDRFRDRLMFPILDASDRVIAFGGRIIGDGEPKYLNSPETPLFNKSKVLYGLNIARKAVVTQDKLIIVEGYMDALTMQVAGFENTAATLGTALTEEHVALISRYTKNVVLAYDADSAGIKAALRSLPIFERFGLNVRILSMPMGEDPDSMLRGGGNDKFSVLIERALPVPDYKIKLALAKHNIKTTEGKAAALKDAVAIIAEVDSGVEQERIIKLLAKFHPNFSSGTTLAEDHLRTEIKRISKGNRAGQPGQNSYTNVLGNKVAEKISLVEKSERLLLGIIIIQNVDITKVFSVVPSNKFSTEECKYLAQVVEKQFEENKCIDQQRLRELVSGTIAEKLLLDLLVGTDESELNHPIDELVQVIVNHKKNERRRRMRALAKDIQDGKVTHNDPEFEEYYKLVRETSGLWRR